MMEPLAPEAAPIVRRMQALWESFRAPVIGVFPKAPGLPKNKKSNLTFVEGFTETTHIIRFPSKGITSRPN
jgi:hypothetical protein